MHHDGSYLRRLAWLPALLPLLPILAGFVLTASSVQAQTGPVAGYRSLTAAPSGPLAVGAGLPAGHGALVALVRGVTVLRRSPGGSVLGQVGARSSFGSATAVWVVSLRPRWLGVVSPVAGNGRLGWIRRDAVSLGRVDWRIRVSLSARRLTVLQAGHVVQRYTVAVGRPSAPTPTGRFDVTDRLTTGDPTGPYGCCILALSAQAPHAIQGWSGGNRIAIHSTPETSSIGLPVSHGCLRLTLAQGRWLLNHIPLGTPTLISA